VVYELAALHPPFMAQDMNGLYHKVVKGVYPRIPRIYSNDLAQLIAQMLTVDPRNRPSAWQVLQMSCALRRAPTPKPVAVSPTLLQTIKVPRNLRQLAERLPRSQYEPPGRAGEVALRREASHSLLSRRGMTPQQLSEHRGVRHQRLASQGAPRTDPVDMDENVRASLRRLREKRLAAARESPLIRHGSLPEIRRPLSVAESPDSPVKMAPMSPSPGVSKLQQQIDTLKMLRQKQ